MDIVLGLLGYKFGWRKVQLLCWILTLLGALMLILPFVFNGFTQSTWREEFSNNSFALWLLFSGISASIMMPIFRRRSALYQAALDYPMGNVPMVANQPVPDSSEIVSPITIRRRIRWPAALAWHAIFFLVATLALAGLTVGDGVLRERLAGAPPEKSSVTIRRLWFNILCLALPGRLCPSCLWSDVLPSRYHGQHPSLRGRTVRVRASGWSQSDQADRAGAGSRWLAHQPQAAGA